MDEEGAPVGEPIPIAAGPSNADFPNAVWTGTGFAIAYSDDVAGGGLDDVYVTFVGCE